MVSLALSNVEDIQRRVHALAEHGIIVSLCYGPCGDKGLPWSVDLLHAPTRSGPDAPFAAHSLGHCIEIAEHEARLREWIQ